MSNTPQPVSPREEQLQRFAELNDKDQALALAWLGLVKESDPERYIAAEELLVGRSLAEETKKFLINDVLYDDILDRVEVALYQHFAERDPLVKRQRREQYQQYKQQRAERLAKQESTSQGSK